jgi:hypothetical protein
MSIFGIAHRAERNAGHSKRETKNQKERAVFFNLTPVRLKTNISKIITKDFTGICLSHLLQGFFYVPLPYQSLLLSDVWQSSLVVIPSKEGIHFLICFSIFNSYFV